MMLLQESKASMNPQADISHYFFNQFSIRWSCFHIHIKLSPIEIIYYLYQLNIMDVYSSERMLPVKKSPGSQSNILYPHLAFLKVVFPSRYTSFMHMSLQMLLIVFHLMSSLSWLEHALKQSCQFYWNLFKQTLLQYRCQPFIEILKISALMMILWEQHYNYPHFTDEETEAGDVGTLPEIHLIKIKSLVPKSRCLTIMLCYFIQSINWVFSYQWYAIL